jgi:hypothetical protein
MCQIRNMVEVQILIKFFREFVESEDEDDDTNVVRIILNNLLDF